MDKAELPRMTLFYPSLTPVCDYRHPHPHRFSVAHHVL